MKPSSRGSVRFMAISTATLLACACSGSEFSAVQDMDGETAGRAGAVAVDSGRGPKAGASPAGASGSPDSEAVGRAGAGRSSAGSGDSEAGNTGFSGAASGGAASGGAASGGAASGGAASGGAAPYLGPTVGTAKSFAALAYSAITAANISPVVGNIGVSAGAVSTITGFDSPLVNKYGSDSIAPNSQLTLLAQQDVTKLVGNIAVRPCDADYTNVVGGLTGDITLTPGVTCMNSFANDVLLNGRVTLDALGNPNAFFIIRGNLTLTVADAAKVVLSNGAQACGVFWSFSKQVTIGKSVQLYGTVIAGSAITMKTGSTIVGRALAQTAGVHLDANSITIPSDGAVGAPGVCTHMQ